MKTYTITEKTVKFEKTNVNGVVSFRPVSEVVICKTDTDDACSTITIYAQCIHSISFDEGKVRRCSICFGFDETTMSEKQIEIVMNK